MKKKIFGIKISTILQTLLCIVLAFIVWFLVQYSNIVASEIKKEAAVAVNAVIPGVLRL